MIARIIKIGLLIAGLCLTPLNPAQAQALSLNEISNYLNGITAATSDFTQINPDNTISTGVVYIQRPGRVRFEYNNDQTLVLASAGNVAIFDSKSNTGAQQYPLAQTPLSIILDRHIDLSRQGMVVARRSQGDKTIIIAQDPAHPEYGTIEMVFTRPAELRQWIITDSSNQKTTVILGKLQKTSNFPASRFSIAQEVRRRQ